MNKHIWNEQKFPGFMNGKQVLDKYFTCSECNKITKVIRANGKIHYLYDDKFAGKLLNGEPACLKLI